MNKNHEDALLLILASNTYCCNIIHFYYICPINDKEYLEIKKRSFCTQSRFTVVLFSQGLNDHHMFLFIVGMILDPNINKDDYIMQIEDGFKCLICNYATKRISNCRRHLFLVHTQQNPVACSRCGKICKSQYHLNMHTKDCIGRITP